MIKVHVYGNCSEYLPERNVELKATTLSQLFRELNTLSVKKIMWRENIIFINDQLCYKRKFVKLSPGDKVSLLSPVAGG